MEEVFHLVSDGDLNALWGKLFLCFGKNHLNKPFSYTRTKQANANYFRERCELALILNADSWVKLLLTL